MTTTGAAELGPDVQELERVTIRFAGDSGDGMPLTGTQFTRTAAVFGNDISTLPDFPEVVAACRRHGMPAGQRQAGGRTCHPARRSTTSRVTARPR